MLASYNLAISAALLTLILVIQLVHYPSFHHYDEATFSQAMREHQDRITWVVMPLMLSELALSGLLIYHTPSALTWLSAGLVGFIWMVTFLVQVPLHAKLITGKDKRAIASLVSGNWLRTGAWALKCVVALLLR